MKVSEDNLDPEDDIDPELQSLLVSFGKAGEKERAALLAAYDRMLDPLFGLEPAPVETGALTASEIAACKFAGCSAEDFKMVKAAFRKV